MELHGKQCQRDGDDPDKTHEQVKLYTSENKASRASRSKVRGLYTSHARY